jgi:hypothetical protein
MIRPGLLPPRDRVVPAGSPAGHFRVISSGPGFGPVVPLAVRSRSESDSDPNFSEQDGENPAYRTRTETQTAVPDGGSVRNLRTQQEREAQRGSPRRRSARGRVAASGSGSEPRDIQRETPFSAGYIYIYIYIYQDMYMYIYIYIPRETPFSAPLAAAARCHCQCTPSPTPAESGRAAFGGPGRRVRV